MEDRKVRTDGWANQTTVNPIGLTMLGVAMAMVLAMSRRWALVAFFVIVCLSARQRIVIATLDFDFIRLLVLVGWVRVFFRFETTGFRWKPMDMVFALWVISGSLAYIALHKTSGAATLQAGQAVTVAGGYFLFRCLIRDWNDIYFVVRAMAIIAVPMAAFFVVEKFTARNFFSAFGGVPHLTQIRYGAVRAQGPYAHSILAGCFWASLVPMFAALWWRKGIDRMLGLTGIGCSLIIVVACASSTPLVSVAAAAFGGGMFLYRFNMRQARWALLGMLILLQAVKTRPVWHMFVYADIIGGSTGWHRFHLIDECIKRIPEWAVMGTRSTAHWGPGLSDVTNQFVLEAARGGMAALLLFIWLLVLAFGSVGRLWRVNQKITANTAMSWALGVTLFTHLTSFFAVSYFGQIVTLLTLHLAMIASLSPTKAQFNAAVARAAARRREAAQAPAPKQTTRAFARDRSRTA